MALLHWWWRKEKWLHCSMFSLWNLIWLMDNSIWFMTEMAWSCQVLEIDFLTKPTIKLGSATWILFFNWALSKTTCSLMHVQVYNRYVQITLVYFPATPIISRTVSFRILSFLILQHIHLSILISVLWRLIFYRDKMAMNFINQSVCVCVCLSNRTVV